MTLPISAAVAQVVLLKHFTQPDGDRLQVVSRQPPYVGEPSDRHPSSS